MRAVDSNTPATHWEQEQTAWRGGQNDVTLRMVIRRKEDEERNMLVRKQLAVVAESVRREVE